MERTLTFSVLSCWHLDTVGLSASCERSITLKNERRISTGNKIGWLLRNPGRDISFPIFIRKEIETRKLERKSKQKISRLIDLLYRLNDIISR